MSEPATAIVESLDWMQPPAPGPSPLTWGLIAAGGLIAVVAVVILLRKRIQKTRPPIPPHEIALRALAELERQATEGNEFEWVIEVSRILREYIQNRFGLRAPHRSTEEFLEEARESAGLSEGDRERLGVFLLQCDLVKFAQRAVVLDQVKELIEAARRFVEDTIPQPNPVGEAARR